jgi:amino acid adenylation domain-containing protein
MADVQPSGAVSAPIRRAVAFDVDAGGDTITRRFATSARDHASSVAVVEGREILTYGELDRRSNQLARLLRRNGVEAGGVVALHAGRSIGSLVAIVAIVKTGAAYAPLDPAAPPAYLEWILGDCGAGLVLSTTCRDSDLPVRTINLGTALAAAGAEAESALDDAATPADIAYVMYTSGSTGRPKGVRVPHRAVLRLVTGQTYARFAADEVFLHAAPLAFDASTFEIWGTLLHGARGVIVEDDHASLQHIADTIQRNHVTTAWFNSGLFNLLVERQLDALVGLRQILAGGDVLSPTHVLRAQAALPDCQLINGYGPTENTTFTCCYRIPRDGWGGGPLPIGTPIRGTYVRVLDDDMRPVADGEIGMLYAGGLGLAAGYIGDARQAALSFVPDPERAGAMLYRTGDLVRCRPDGTLSFVGRRDRQVKIDGKRVELGEIEETLRRSGRIADAIVTTGQDRAGSSVLAAYVKPAPNEQACATSLAEECTGLLRALPSYMRPSEIVVLDEFPLTTSGKIDYARLPAPRPVEPSAMTWAKDGVERTLSDIFARVLGVRMVGRDTNFFDLGATSLKLIEAHEAIERVWPGVHAMALFQHPNIRELAAAISGRGTSRRGSRQRRTRQQAEALKQWQRATPA